MAAMYPPECDHRPVVRVSSHVDLAAATWEEGTASTYCCGDLFCIDRAREWVESVAGQAVIVPLPGRAYQPALTAT